MQGLGVIIKVASPFLLGAAAPTKPLCEECEAVAAVTHRPPPPPPPLLPHEALIKLFVVVVVAAGRS